MPSSQRGDVDISQIGALLADRARCRMLLALNDGRALTAGVLADEAGVARSTASSHLGKLTDAGLLQVERDARTCYDHLAGRLGVSIMGVMLNRGYLGGGDGSLPSIINRHPDQACQDHLSGLGRAIQERFVDAGWIERRKAGRIVWITPDGRAALTDHFGLNWT